VGALCERWSRLHARWALDERDVPMAIAGFDALAAAPPVARTMAHGDFWARNVLFDDGHVSGVVDWEHATRDASPFDDLFHYVIAYGAAWPWSHGRPDAGHAFACTFVTETRVSRAVTVALAAWRSRAGVRARAMRSLFLLHLLERAEAASHGDAGRDLAPTRDYWLACYRTIAEADRSVFSG
jgi:aminoglycoside phosphotransferase (APT) family kinase protein